MIIVKKGAKTIANQKNIWYNKNTRRKIFEKTYKFNDWESNL